MNNTNKKSYALLLAIVLITALIRIPTLFSPWGGDQGTFGFIANGILEGKIPYKDMYTSSGYGLYFLYVLFFKLFGNSMTALNIGDLLAAICTVILVYSMARYLYGSECAVYSGILASVFGSGRAFSYLVDMKGAWGTYWQLSQRETFMLPFITAGFLIALIYDSKKSGMPYFGVGILIGLSVALKYTSLLIAFFLVIYLFYAEVLRKDRNGFYSFVIKTIFIFFGIILIQIPFLYYFWINDSLLSMYNAVFVHTSIYAKLSRGNIIANAFMGNTFILNENAMLWLFSFSALIFLIRKDSSRVNWLVFVWTVGSLLSVWGQGKFFGYHFILIIAPFSVLSGFGVKQFLKTDQTWIKSIQSAKNNLAQIFLWIFIFYNLASFSWNHYEYYKWSLLYAFGKITKVQYYEVYNEYPLHNYSFRSDNDIASYLKLAAKQNASLRTINGGGDTVIHYLTGLNSTTKFTSTWYLFNPNLYDDPITAQLRYELIEGIKTEKPDYILLVYYSMDEFREIYKDDKYKDTIMLMNYINQKYTLEKIFRDGRTLYKKNFI